MTGVADLRIRVKWMAQIYGFSYLNCDNRYGEWSAVCWLVSSTLMSKHYWAYIHVGLTISRWSYHWSPETKPLHRSDVHPGNYRKGNTDFNVSGMNSII